MSASQTEFLSQTQDATEEQPLSSLSLKLQQQNSPQLKWRKGANSSPSTTLQSLLHHSSNIAKSSSTDFVIVASSTSASGSSSPCKKEQNREQLLSRSSDNCGVVNNTSVADLKQAASATTDLSLRNNDFKLLSAEEATASSSTPALGSDSATTRLQIIPSPEAIRISFQSDSLENPRMSAITSSSLNHKALKDIKLRPSSVSSFSSRPLFPLDNSNNISQFPLPQFKSVCRYQQAVTHDNHDQNSSPMKMKLHSHNHQSNPDFISIGTTTHNATGLPVLTNSHYYQNDRINSGGNTPSTLRHSQHNQRPHSLSIDVANTHDATSYCGDEHQVCNTSGTLSLSSVSSSSRVAEQRRGEKTQLEKSKRKTQTLDEEMDNQNKRNDGVLDLPCHQKSLSFDILDEKQDDQLQASTSADSLESSRLTDLVGSPNSDHASQTDELDSTASDEHASGSRGRCGSTLCQCPCRNCATCPLRGLPQNRSKKDSKRHYQHQQESNTWGGPFHPQNDQARDTIVNDVDVDVDSRPRAAWTRVKRAVINFCMLEAKDSARFKYDVRIIPEHPLPNRKQRLLEITELPFLILWAYFTYWAVIAAMTASCSPATVWLSAGVASILVGIGLNANAYKSVTVPRRRGAVRHHRHARALLELRKYGESIDTVEMKIDWGMVIRFFIIPFGVSSLSGLTNSNRDNFLLVFPRDPFYLMIALLCPTVVVTCLALLRLVLLWKLKIRWSLQGLFLNGALVD